MKNGLRYKMIISNISSYHFQMHMLYLYFKYIEMESSFDINILIMRLFVLSKNHFVVC